MKKTKMRNRARDHMRGLGFKQSTKTMQDHASETRNGRTVQPNQRFDGAPETYRCTLCEERYPHEVLARVHVSRADDPHHMNYSGFDGDVPIQSFSRQRGNNGDELPECGHDVVRDLEIEHIPEKDPRLPADHDDRHRHIILVAARNFDENYLELTDRISSVFDQRDVEQLSYSTIRRTLRKFFQPNPDASEGDEESGMLTERTPLQNALIIAMLANPDEPDHQIADRLGCAQSYPAQLRSRSGETLTQLREAIHDGGKLETVVGQELTEGNVTALQVSGYAEKLKIDVDTLQSAVDGEGDVIEEPDVAPAIEVNNEKVTGTRRTLERLGELVSSHREYLEANEIDATDRELLFVRMVDQELEQVRSRY